VHEDVELAPPAADRIEHRLERARHGDVHRHEDLRAELLRERLDVGSASSR